MTSFWGRMAHVAHDHRIVSRCLMMAGVALTFAVAAEQAQARSGDIKAVIEEAVAAAAPVVGVPEHLMWETVFEGADIDGDGTADFVNPTGRDVRRHDDFGHGHYGARRDGGSREHAGVDYIGLAGQTVAAPISGVVTKMGYAYGADPSLKYVEITNAALNTTARVFYVNPTVAIGERVALGEKVGVLTTLQNHYPGITDHVHLEVRRGGDTMDAEEVILAHRVRREMFTT